MALTPCSRALDGDGSVVEPAKLPHPQIVAQGAYGYVVEGSCERRVVKVFYDNGNANDQERRKRVAQWEMDAYKLANSDPELRKLVPAFYGQVDAEQFRVVYKGHVACSITPLAGCAFEMERLTPLPVKSGPLPEPLVRLFQAAGIHYTTDVSILKNDKNEVIRVVDFQTKHEDP